MITPEALTMIGCHRLGRRIGCGAQGEVYEAYDTRMERTVALKLLHGGPRSAAEIKAIARLDHPNIVPIYEAGEHDGSLYFTMKLLAGSLTDPDMRRPFIADPDAAAQLVETLARAVHYFHQLGILHRDLKPGNVLLDLAGTPYIAHFGVAPRLEDDGRRAISGTRRYMSPEQLDGHASVYGDIYSLGVVLYELITGCRPFTAETVAELTREIKERSPADPRELRPGLHPDLAQICLRSLEKTKENRHPSALALADALRRHLQGELPEGAPRRRRAWRWCVRHPMTAGLLAAMITFLFIMIPVTVSLVGEHEATRRAQLTQTNMSRAAMVAGTVLSQLRELGDIVATSARDPLLVAAIERGDPELQRTFCEGLYRDHDIRRGQDPANNSPFDTWFILDTNGRLIAQGGKTNVRVLGLDYAWRDYYKGAWQLAELGARSTYVSRVFESENDRFHKFALSAPIYDERGEPIGVLVAAVAAAAHLRSLVLDDPDSTTVLAGPRDRGRDHDHEPDPSHVILLHPHYRYGEADPLVSPEVEWLDRASRGKPRIEEPLRLPPSTRMTASDDYRDPAAGRHSEYGGRWLAGFAPVGNTGFVVIVETPYAVVLASEMAFGGRLVQWACISAVPGALLVLLAAWHRRRRARPPTPRGGPRLGESSSLSLQRVTAAPRGAAWAGGPGSRGGPAPPRVLPAAGPLHRRARPPTRGGGPRLG